MQRAKRKDIDYILGYHTQEFRSAQQPLTSPIECRSHEAWLGFGYYFWTEEEFAHYWGKDSKTKTGQYDIYTAYIGEDNLLNSSFNEEGYYFFKDSIEKAIAKFKKEGKRISLEAVHRFLVDEFWPHTELQASFMMTYLKK